MSSHFRLATVVLVLTCSPVLGAQQRMAPIPADKMTDAQKKAAAEFAEARTPDIRGPWVPFLRSPELMSRVRATSDYLRFNSTLSPKLVELVVLITARHWTQNYEWNAHHPAALKEGLDPQIASSIAEGRRPVRMADDEAIIYDLITEVLKSQDVSDATYAKAVARFGEKGVIDAVCLSGHYTLISMVLNTARVALPANTKPALAPLSR